MKLRWVVGLFVLAAIAVAIAAAKVWPRLSRELGRQPPDVRVLSEEEKAAVPPLLAGPWGQGRDEHVGKVPTLHGATEERVLAALGAPSQTYEFPVEDGGDEFRIELWNTYPPGDARSWGVRIREWQWRYKEFSFAAWFHKVGGRWVVLDTCRWRKGIVF
jgi:hypothetical protein